MARGDATWAITITVQVATSGGWKPEFEDIGRWLDHGGTLELISVDSVHEDQQAYQP